MNQFRYIKKFEGMPKPLVCPSFWELRWAYGCVFNCEYCYLLGTLYGKKIIPHQKYLERKRVLERELPIFFEEVSEPCLLNSGELADSLMFETTKEPFVPWVTDIFKSQSKHKHLVLTKSINVDNLLKVEGQKVTVFSMSINTVEMWKYEGGTPSPTARVLVCDRVQKAGYEVRLRIDFPMGDVKSLIDLVYKGFRPDRITLSVPRINNARLWQYPFWQKMKPQMEHVGKGKWRLNRSTSLEKYLKLIELIRKYDEHVPIALCKETEEMWRKVGLNHEICLCNCQL